MVNTKENRTMTAEQERHDEFVVFCSGEYNASFRLTLDVDGGIRSSAALVSLNRELDKPLGQVKLGVRALTFTLHQDGYPVEYSAQGESWSPVLEPKFDAMSHDGALVLDVRKAQEPGEPHRSAAGSISLSPAGLGQQLCASMPALPQ
ncbi:hypothetical protein AB4Y43_27600 [Paraburkholderia sp. BR10872]|uniref:hypothetical protein n=1 Tax=Paraburkholderia sp. BR10872 TaxID=3236989 RepID=UPI0034D1929E